MPIRERGDMSIEMDNAESAKKNLAGICFFRFQKTMDIISRLSEFH
jgi:hypothetical protein